MGDDEMSLFLEEMAGVQPLKNNTTATISEKAVSTQAQDARRKQLQMSEQLALLTLDPHLITASEPDAIVEFKRDGVQEAVFHRLRLGGYPSKFEIDLHMLKPQQAREVLYQQIILARERGERNIIVIHGKGAKTKPYPALMKSFAINWLEQIDEVLAFHSAQLRHGGAGALYVMLAKSEQKRIETKETNHKGVNVR
ncbi:DNA endonuclease SmrA [Shewanella fidelis]|uniref:DNA endonuclease SmrA n=1 Tax=Shewanella fidelis TaxID=173509 RepID=A0AAW8NNV4_9GAMM|nr:DNA endonuclease SmrA [Shewanella fidelis]MDR8523995.1 DNA endonuclease SmrA [Shewanella fidelis]MDW4810542.1 DNA endonuclease SmrA [Shewanella fidelis]MDW4814663.1 DNA endonuclease SmrA [Shewanella fidelis]MDW4818753.1 DNA endonuclease SmrA [Shewanella fidelis]MDW4823570.1 DNA endonuclease SmrA [Shewanella fidelis]